MKSSYSTLMQSKFFNPAFNSAIFDGPVRIYFSQFHESLALKIYFGLQQNYLDLMNDAKEAHKNHGNNILVMIYPSQEAFEMSFDGKNCLLCIDELEEDGLIAINGPFEDEQLPEVLKCIADSVKKCNNSIHAEPKEAFI